MNKKKVWISIIVVAVVALGIIGCKAQDQKKWQPIDQIVESFFDAYNKNDKSLTNYVLDEEGSNPGSCLYYSRFLQDNVTYKILDHYKEDDEYIVEVDITTIDVPRVMDQNEKLYQDIETMSYLDDNVKKFQAIKDKPMKTRHAKLHIEEFEGAYYLVLDQDSLDALSGGFHTYDPSK